MDWRDAACTGCHLESQGQVAEQTPGLWEAGCVTRITFALRAGPGSLKRSSVGIVEMTYVPVD